MFSVDSPGPQTFTDGIMDQRARQIWWSCMDKIEEHLKNAVWAPERVEALASAAAAAATQILEEPSKDTSDDWG